MSPETVRFATEAMGTRFEIVLIGDHRTRLVAAGEAAIERIEEAHRSLTRFDHSSLIGHLRRVAPRPVAVDRATFALFAAAEQVQERSDGSFDITGGTGGLAVDAGVVTVALLDADVPIDLGAIAKGHAIDLAAEVLRDAGVERGFIHGGTSSAIGIGRPDGTSEWRVALGDGPDSVTVDLTDSALSVSGSKSQRGNDLVRHIRDPRTGAPIDVDRRVAVWGPSAMLADAWSTAVIVLGRRPATLGPPWRVWLEEDRGRWTEIGTSS